MTTQCKIFEFKLRPRKNEILSLADKYTSNPKEMELENKIVFSVTPKILQRGFLTLEDLKLFSLWKSGHRTKRLVQQNEDRFVREVTSSALRSKDERFRIEVLTLLNGVSWPTASIILHVCIPNTYPVIDFRALWSLRIEQKIQYDYNFWKQYTRFCKRSSIELGIDMRTLDRALWQYSADNQPPSTPSAPPASS